MKIIFALSALVGVSAFAPHHVQQVASSTALFNGPVIGKGGMADTRDPDALVHEDPRKSIAQAPSFEEYMKQRAGGGAAPAAAPAAPVAAPAAAAPAPAATGGSGGVLDTLATLEGPGQVWGAEGIAVGKEESDLKEYDNFNLFYDRLKSTGVAAELAGAGPYTIFAPVNTAIQTYEMLKGPVDANVLKMHIVPGNIASADVKSATLNSLAGPLKYRYAVRKHFINDVIIGEKTFGPYADYPMDVKCSNGVIHGVGLMFA
uniref:FAS1 domain-containing protein n=1 Tax=Amphora coffeiformis TaxID=265554 RepID=A0A7S3L5P4_9STRA|mmetsp:Transcript_24152/g.45979  ORF Transcript_24152/g.45979 Transcript_24152/m.45979 type:complete len:260 (+) Transcript_24152:91-870(+)